MIVVYNKPRMITLCYGNGINIKTFSFIPGRNEIPKTEWDKILESNKEIMQNCHMKDFSIICAESDPKTGLETSNDDRVEIKNLTIKDLKKLIEGTLEPDGLKEFKSLEESRLVDGKLKPRKIILDAIDKQMEKVNKIYKKNG